MCDQWTDPRLEGALMKLRISNNRNCVAEFEAENARDFAERILEACAVYERNCHEPTGDLQIFNEATSSWVSAGFPDHRSFQIDVLGIAPEQTDSIWHDLLGALDRIDEFSGA